MKRLAAMGLALFAAALVGGCAPNEEYTYQLHDTFGEDLITPAHTMIEHDNRIARTFILNEDLGNEEFTRFMLFDKPGASAWYPVE